MSDKHFLNVMRVCLVCFSIGVLFYASNSELSIFHMVESAYKITLAGAFTPLVFGIFWKKANDLGALAAIIGGIGSWVIFEVLFGENFLVPPQLVGLIMSMTCMVVFSLIGSKAEPVKQYLNN